MELYNKYFNTNENWKTLINECKIYLNYDRQMRKDGKQGVFLGLKIIINNNTIELLNELEKNNLCNSLKDFLKEKCDIKKHGFVFTSELYNDFKKKYPNINNKIFCKLIEQNGYPNGKRNGYKGFRGLSLKNNKL